MLLLRAFVLAALATSSTAYADTTGSSGTSDSKASKPDFSKFNEVEYIQQPPVIVLPRPAPKRTDQFRYVEGELMPMKPDEIRRYREILNQREQAINETAPPKLNSKTVSVSMTPGAAIPSVTIAPQYVSAIVVVDSFGNPWPISGVNNGSPNVFQVEVPQKAGEPNNVINVAALQRFGNSNISVSLAQQSVPLIISMRVDQKQTDIRADMVIAEAGPLTNPILTTGSGVVGSSPDATMMAFVDGVPPAEAVAVDVQHPGFRVWQYGGVLFVRTTAAIKTPRPDAVSHGSGGVRVYRMKQTPLIMFSEQGRISTVRVPLSVAHRER